jgi:pimeloyl-ACP methyl ester carboxylesterase
MLSAISHPLTGMPWFFKPLFFGLMKINFLPWLLFRVSPASVYQTNGVNRALLEHIRRDPEKMKLLRDLATTSMLPALRRAGMMNDWQQTTQMTPFPLDQITVPTLVIHAVNDPVVAFEFGRYSATHIPGAHLLEVEDGGHFCCVTHREKVVPALTQFLKRHLS